MLFFCSPWSIYIGSVVKEGKGLHFTHIRHLTFQHQRNLVLRVWCSVQLFSVDYSEKKSWEAARLDCVAREADLISIHNFEEENFLATYTKGKTSWIGLRHNPIESGYEWSDGSPVSHTNWGHGEPNDHGDREDCVELVTTANELSMFYHTSFNSRTV
uniref:C-type lectin domain-containing protein n=1 Tax=Denticeps clupeoides TaxID=299321 RepID=A0AAY4ERU6_9TELE